MLLVIIIDRVQIPLSILTNALHSKGTGSDQRLAQWCASPFDAVHEATIVCMFCNDFARSGQDALFLLPHI